MTAEIKLPEAIGPYRIKNKLGQGGMGAVFHAVHETLERPVALKILPFEMASDPEYVTRFLREARVVATLRQENVVQVYDAGSVDGKYFIAMELVDGTTLGKYLEEKGCLDEKECLELLLQASKGLAAAHAKELVHRDIKPDNLLLDKDRKTLRIVDFGLVMESASTTQLTATGACLGTPQYMSPEQADGEKADARTDIYSLGVTFYRALTGKPPFTSPTVMNLLFKHKFEAPPDPRIEKPGLSPDACNLVLTMMAKRREDRPQSAQAIVDLITGLSQGKKIPPPPAFQSPLGEPGAVTVLSQTVKTASDNLGSGTRRMAPVIAGVAAGVIVLALAAWFMLGGSDKSGTTKNTQTKSGGDTKKSELPADRISTDSGTGSSDPADKSAAKRNELIEEARRLEKAGDLALALQRYEEASKIGDPDSLNTPREDLRYRILVQESAAYERQGNLTAALGKARAAHLIRDASDLINRLKKKEKVKSAESAELAGDWAAAATGYEEAANLSENTERELYLQKTAACRANALKSLGEQLEAQQDWDGAAKAYTQALSIKPDPVLEARRNALLKKSPGTDQYSKYMEDGDKALTEGVAALGKGDRTTADMKFSQAHANFVLAFQAKPGSTVPGEKMKEAEAYRALVRGDEDKARGDLVAARFEYNKVSGLCPKLAGLARQKLQLLGPETAQNPSPTPPVYAPPANSDGNDAVIARADQLVREGQTDEALRQVSAAARAKPADATLARVRSGLESLQACETTLNGLLPILREGLQAASEAQGIDGRDSSADTLKERLEERERDDKEKLSLARAKFTGHNYEGVRDSLNGARVFAQGLGGDFDDAENRYLRKAEEKDPGIGVKGPFGFKVNIGGNKDKSDRYKRLAATFGELERKAKAYGH